MVPKSFRFFNDNNNFMLVILLKPAKYINLYQFKIHIFYRKLSLHKNFARIYYFAKIYIIVKKSYTINIYVEKNMIQAATRRG